MCIHICVYIYIGTLLAVTSVHALSVVFTSNQQRGLRVLLTRGSSIKNMGSKTRHNSTRVFGMPPTTRILNLENKARAVSTSKEGFPQSGSRQKPMEKGHEIV